MKAAFVLVFQRPEDLEAPDRDPDSLSEIPADFFQQLLPPAGRSYQRVALIALGQGRELIGPFLRANPCHAIDIVLETACFPASGTLSPSHAPTQERLHHS